MHLGKTIAVKEQNPIHCNADSWCAAIARKSLTKTLRSPAPTAKAIALVALEIAIVLAAPHVLLVKPNELGFNVQSSRASHPHGFSVYSVQPDRLHALQAAVQGFLS
jgi:hypothetical protein